MPKSFEDAKKEQIEEGQSIIKNSDHMFEKMYGEAYKEAAEGIKEEEVQESIDAGPGDPKDFASKKLAKFHVATAIKKAMEATGGRRHGKSRRGKSRSRRGRKTRRSYF